MSISPLATVHPDAQIGTNVTIESGAWIAADVVIGNDTWIGPNAIVMTGARIGKRCKIYPGAIISGDPQDLKYRGEKTETFIGDDTIIREYVTIHRGTADKWMTKIGNNCLIMAYCHVAHDCIVGDRCIFSNNSTLAGHIVVEDDVTIAGLCAVQQFMRIGAHSFIAGSSLVRKSVPPFTRVAREPLTYMGVNSVGLSRKGYSQDTINEIQDIYRTLYLRKLNVSDAITVIKSEFSPSAVRDQILTFVEDQAVKGIVRGPGDDIIAY